MNIPVGEDEIVYADILLLVKPVIVSALVVQLRMTVGGIIALMQGAILRTPANNRKGNNLKVATEAQNYFNTSMATFKRKNLKVYKL